MPNSCKGQAKARLHGKLSGARLGAPWNGLASGALPLPALKSIGGAQHCKIEAMLRARVEPRSGGRAATRVRPSRRAQQARFTETDTAGPAAAAAPASPEAAAAAPRGCAAPGWRGSRPCVWRPASQRYSDGAAAVHQRHNSAQARHTWGAPPQQPCHAPAAVLQAAAVHTQTHKQHTQTTRSGSAALSGAAAAPAGGAPPAAPAASPPPAPQPWPAPRAADPLRSGPGPAVSARRQDQGRHGATVGRRPRAMAAVRESQSIHGG